MMEDSNYKTTVDAIAEILARGVCRWWKNNWFQQDNTLNQLDNSRNKLPYVHRKTPRQRRNYDD